MPLLTRKRIITAALEATPGTAETIAGADAVLVRNLTLTPLAADTIERELVRPYLGNSDLFIANQRVEVEFEVEISGSGTATTAPAYAEMMQACGMDSAVYDEDGDTTDDSWTFTPTSNNLSGYGASAKTVTIGVNIDGFLHKFAGCRGNVSLNFPARAIPYFTFTFTGIYSAPTATAAVTPTYSYTTPVVCNNTNTFQGASDTISIAGSPVTSPVIESLEFNLNNEVNFRSLIGSESADLVNRSPSGTLVIEAITSPNVFTAALGSTLSEITLTHGTTAGNIVAIELPYVDIGQPTYVDQNGIHMLSIPFTAQPSSSGNDEFRIVTK